jgi:hypothetical protein
MYRLTKYNVDIFVKLDPGIYVFDNQSATGKTRLADLLSKFNAYGEPVASYTYNDKLKGLTLEQMLGDRKYDVILLDRYDMYNGEYTDIIEKYSKSGVVLIDCKSELKNIEDDDWCMITMDSDRIEVEQ